MIDKLFNPSSVCIVGVSLNDNSKWGNQILNNLLEGGYQGNIYPVNKKGGYINDLVVYKSILDTPSASISKMVVICVPAQFVGSILEECGQTGIKNVIIITAGFGEVGETKLALKNKELIKKYDLNVIGENTFGTISTHNNLNVSLIKPFDKKGGINIYVQSGTLGIVLADRLSKMDTIGLNDLVSMGNMIGLDFSDLITYANNDDNCKVILLYMEDVKEGKAFIQSARNCNKPIVVLKGGRSVTGSKAASSHTGAMAGSDVIYSTAFKQAGIIQVDTINELFMAAEVLSRCKIPKGNRVGILSPGGGSNISCVDFCEKYGLEIPTFSNELQKKIMPFLPPTITSANNPVDTGASFDFNNYHSIIKEIINSGEVDIFITNFVMTDGYITDWENEFVPMYVYGSSPIPIIGSWMGAEGIIRQRFEEHIPMFDEPAQAAQAAKWLTELK